MLRDYKLRDLGPDVFAGFVLTAVLIPTGMAYAQAAGLPAITGLYATIFPLLAYAIFGPSRILVLGPDSALAAVIASALLPMTAGDPARALTLAAVLAILSGVLCTVAGIARFGFITDLLSKPIRYGYLNGIALIVIVSQIPKLLGFSATGASLVEQASGIWQGVVGGRINAVACGIGFSCLVVIFVFRRWAPRIPGVLVAVVGATLAVWYFGLAGSGGVLVVGPLPQGLPSFALPDVSFSDWTTLLAAAFAITLVSFADISVLSRTFAIRGGYEVEPNQEFIALGAANIAAGCFQGFPVSSSASRTPVAESVGSRTQVTGVVGAVCISVMLVAAPGLLADLPAAALAAVVIAACVTIVDVRGVVRLYHLRRTEFALSIMCFLGVAMLGTVRGVLIAVGVALLAFIWRAWRPYSAVLGRVDGLKGYHDISRHPGARLIPGLILFRWDAPLFFANAEVFRQLVRRAVAEAPTPTKWVVVAAEPVTDVDTTAADMLAALDEELHAAGMDLCFAEMKDPVKDHLKKYGLFNRIGTESFFPTIGQAVDRYLQAHKVQWRDWDE